MNKIKKLRLAKGMTQEELAKKVGITQSNLSRIENGDVQLSFKLAQDIARELNCKLDDLKIDPETEEDHENDNAE